MDFPTFLETVFDENIHLDSRAWICDIHLEEVGRYILRNIIPQEVVIDDNANLPAGKIIYYSPVHFHPIGKKGLIKKQIIPPFDKTGRDDYPGVGVLIFDNRAECIKAYNEQCDSILRDISSRNAASEDDFKSQKHLILTELAKYSDR